MPRGIVRAALIAVAGTGCISMVPAAMAASSDAALQEQFTQTVRPFVTQYCVGCHSGKAAAAGFNLKEYSSMQLVIADFPRWNIVSKKLTAKEMPPKVAPQPAMDRRQRVIDWIQAVRTYQARRNAGDPGPVLPRRLSNAEYNYTIRDLTGVDLRPAREFPVDPTNPAGFDNSGESLATSPALLKKYLQAAHEVADHMVLTPDGITFAPYPMLVETDRDKYSIQRIVAFYNRQPTDFADYFEAAWRYEHRAALGEPRVTLASIAAESKVSAKYLPMVWGILEEPPSVERREVGPIAKLQAMWRALPDPNEKQPDLLRAKCVEMRDFVLRVRRDTAMQFAAPVVKGLSPWSQPLINYKFQEFNTHRRDFDHTALRVASDPPPVVPEIPKYPGLGKEAAVRAAAVMLKNRAADPDLVVPDGQRELYEASFARFSSVFPDAFYIQERGRFFPDDTKDKGRLLSAGYHNVMGYWRDDLPLRQLILDDEGNQELNRLWNEFDFISDYTRRTWIQYYFNQSGEVSGHGRESGSQRPSDEAVTAPQVVFGLRDEYLEKAKANPDNDPAAVEAIQYHFQWENDTMRAMERERAAAEPRHLDALLKFAERAYRRPLSKEERDSILAFYHELREKWGLTHEEAMRNSIAGILMSPDFSLRLDLVDASGDQAVAKVPVRRVSMRSSLPVRVRPLSGYALASRLSYFLWSSMPDQELLAHAAAGDLQKPQVLLAQARRMLKDERVMGLATEFGGNWLDFRHFEQNNSVDRQRFPTFNDALREAMFQEPIRMIADMVQNNRSVLDLLYGDYTFVNPVLAKHYGMPEVPGDDNNWVRVDNASKYKRGGILPMAVFLTENSPGLRTSPVKRGHWLVRSVLGEVIPPPPPVVPELPSDESKSDLPVRAMLAKHRQNPVCAGCHSRFDEFGLVFEGYGPVGEARTKDLGGRPIDDSAGFPGGSKGAGYEGVLTFIREHRQNEYVDHLIRELLAYALSRSLMLSDEPTVERMRAQLTASGYRFDSLVAVIVASPQFSNIRDPEPRENPDSQQTRGE